MSPFWETLDKIGIALGIGAIVVDIVVWVYIKRMSDDVEDMQEDVEDIEEEINGNKNSGR